MEVFLTREIRNEDGYVDEVVNSIKNVPEDEELVMLITCIGGDTFQGDRLYRAILEHPNKTRAIVIGLAASMAASILSAFDMVELDPDSQLMFHKARVTNDSGKVLEEYTPEQQEQVDIFNEKTYERFVKSGADRDFLYQVFLSDNNENFWLTAQEAENLRFGVVVAIERRTGEPVEAFENAYKLAAKLDISHIKETFNQEKMGLFNKNKEVPRVHALADDRQVIVTSAKENIEVGDTLTLVGSNDSLKGKIRLANNMEAEIDAENKVVNLEEVENEVTDEEKAAIMQRLADLEQAVKTMMEKMGERAEDAEEVEDKKEELENKEKELEDSLAAVKALAEESLKAASTIQTTAKLDKPEGKGSKEVPNMSDAQQHVLDLMNAKNLELKED